MTESHFTNNVVRSLTKSHLRQECQTVVWKFRNLRQRRWTKTVGDLITGPDWLQIFFLSSYIKVKLNADGITILLVNNHLLAVKALVFNAGDRSKRGERGRIENRARNSNLFMLLPITCFVCFSLKLSTKGKILTRKTITKHGEPGRMSVRTSRQEAGWQKYQDAKKIEVYDPVRRTSFLFFPDLHFTSPKR